MPTYAALLRAVNLGSHNKISMPRLRELFAALGAEDVETYVQSGNVVFRSPGRSAEKLSRAIEERIRSDLGLDVKTLVRTKAELAQIVSRNPFLDRVSDPKKLHVAFLAEAPARARVRALEPPGPEELRVVGREVYLHYPDGYGRTKLHNAYLEKRLGVAATTRNWRTVTTLAELTKDRR